VFIGQPAEEIGAGALAMLNDGLFKKFPKPDFALACMSIRRCGREGRLPCGIHSGERGQHRYYDAGKGGHGAYPHTTIDPIVQAAQLIVDLQTDCQP